MLYFADVSTVFFGMFSVVLRGCSVLTSFLQALSTGTLLFLGRCPCALASEGVDGRSFLFNCSCRNCQGILTVAVMV